MDERDMYGDESGNAAMSDLEVRLRLSVALTGQGYRLPDLDAQVAELCVMREDQRAWMADMQAAGIRL